MFSSKERGLWRIEITINSGLVITEIAINSVPRETGGGWQTELGPRGNKSVAGLVYPKAQLSGGKTSPAANRSASVVLGFFKFGRLVNWFIQPVLTSLSFYEGSMDNTALGELTGKLGLWTKKLNVPLQVVKWSIEEEKKESMRIKGGRMEGKRKEKKRVWYRLRR